MTPSVGQTQGVLATQVVSANFKTRYIYSALTDWFYKVTVVHKVSFAHVDRHLEHRAHSVSGWTPPNHLKNHLAAGVQQQQQQQLTDLSRETFLKMTCLGLMVMMSQPAPQ